MGHGPSHSVCLQVGVGLEAIRLVAAHLRFQAEVPDFSGDVARRVVELLQVQSKPQLQMSYHAQLLCVLLKQGKPRVSGVLVQ